MGSLDGGNSDVGKGVRRARGEEIHCIFNKTKRFLDLLSYLQLLCFMKHQTPDTKSEGVGLSGEGGRLLWFWSVKDSCA